ncbi:retrovirus-related pol polyprotein from transposon TNT 1-94 [Tanacetum coccineum]
MDTTSLRETELTGLHTIISACNNELMHQLKYRLIHPTQHYSSIYPLQPQFNHSSVLPSCPYQSQMNHQTSSVPQIAYQSPQVSTQPITESPLVDLGFAVPVFSLGDDLIACLNKAMAFLTAVASSRFPSTNNQLNKRSDESKKRRATIREMAGSHSEGAMGCTRGGDGRSKYYGTCIRVMLLFKGETNASRHVKWCDVRFWMKDQLPFLWGRSIGFLDGQAGSEQSFQTKRFRLRILIRLMILTEVPHSETYLNDMENQGVHAMQDFEQPPAVRREKMIDSQMDDMIKEKLALKEQVDSLEQIFLNKSKKRNIVDEETLILEEESQSKMSEKEKDLEAIKQNISHKPIDYEKLNRLSDDFGKRFTPQQELSAEQSDQAKAKQPLDKELDFACKHAQRIQELLVYVRDTCPNAINLSAKKVAVTPKNKVKKVRFVEPLTSSSNIKQVESLNTSDSNTPILSSTGLKCSTSKYGSKTTGNKRNDRISQTPSRNMKNKVKTQPIKVNKKNHVVEPIHDNNVKHSLLNENSEPICATCKKSMFDGVHDMCILDFVENVNSRAKSAKKHKKQNIWKPTGHVFTEVRLKWKPTGRTFTIVGNLCPLTRITSANIVPHKKTTSHSVVEIVLWNDHIVRIIGYGDYQLGNVTISRVYYSEGLGHNLFSVGQFCNTDLEVAFRKNTCYIRNLEGVNLLFGSRDTNLYIISLDDMLTTSLICLLSKASNTKSWLLHRRLSHLNFVCALGKSKKSSRQPKAEDTNQEKLYLLHMDLCGPMRVVSINGKRYILVIVDDYSRFTWFRFLRTKDEAPKAIIKCIKNIQVRLNATVRNV